MSGVDTTVTQNQLSFSMNCTGDGAIQSALTSGEWFVDDNMSTEQQALAQRLARGPSETNSSSSLGGSEATGVVKERSPKLVPVKSFQTDILNISVSCLSWAMTNYCSDVLRVLSLLVYAPGVCAYILAWAGSVERHHRTSCGRNIRYYSETRLPAV
jgi:hypothetical protein